MNLLKKNNFYNNKLFINNNWYVVIQKKKYSFLWDFKILIKEFSIIQFFILCIFMFIFFFILYGILWFWIRYGPIDHWQPSTNLEEYERAYTWWDDYIGRRDFPEYRFYIKSDNNNGGLFDICFGFEMKWNHYTPFYQKDEWPFRGFEWKIRLAMTKKIFWLSEIYPYYLLFLSLLTLYSFKKISKNKFEMPDNYFLKWEWDQLELNENYEFLKKNSFKKILVYEKMSWLFFWIYMFLILNLLFFAYFLKLRYGLIYIKPNVIYIEMDLIQGWKMLTSWNGTDLITHYTALRDDILDNRNHLTFLNPAFSEFWQNDFFFKYISRQWWYFQVEYGYLLSVYRSFDDEWFLIKIFKKVYWLFQHRKGVLSLNHNDIPYYSLPPKVISMEDILFPNRHIKTYSKMFNQKFYIIEPDKISEYIPKSVWHERTDTFARYKLDTFFNSFEQYLIHQYKLCLVFTVIKADYRGSIDLYPNLWIDPYYQKNCYDCDDDHLTIDAYLTNWNNIQY